ncbi:MAG TPA: hypothetical protein VIV40_03720 [Kofleriaceae bacterium]
MKLVAVAGVLVGVGLSGVAHADDPLARPEAFDVDREAPPPGQAEFSFDGGGSVAGWAVGAQLGYLDRPLRLHTTQIKIFPVHRRETLALGGAYMLTPAFLVDVRMPFSHQSGDRLIDLGDQRPLDPWVAGDLGIGMRLRLADRDAFSIFVRANLTFGTGNDYQFAGESRYTAAWSLIGRFRLPEHIVLAGSLGVRFRGEEVIVADRVLSDELVGALGASYQLPAIRGLYCDANEVRLTVELHGVLGNDVGDFEGASPAEARVGVVSRIRPWLAVAARLGKGIDDHIGAPTLRGMLEVVYVGGAR